MAFIGAGVSHKTLIKEFVELGAHVTLCDQKNERGGLRRLRRHHPELGIDLSLGENYLDASKGQDIIMRTPWRLWATFEETLQDAHGGRYHGSPATVELFFDFCPCPIVAVTGSDGKTTTTTLIAKFFEAAGRKVHLGGTSAQRCCPCCPR